MFLSNGKKLRHKGRVLNLSSSHRHCLWAVTVKSTLLLTMTTFWGVGGGTKTEEPPNLNPSSDGITCLYQEDKLELPYAKTSVQSKPCYYLVNNEAADCMFNISFA